MSEATLERSTGLARAERSLDRLHPDAITDPASIREILERIGREQLALHRGMNKRIQRELAWVESIGDDECVLRTHDFEPGTSDPIFLNFSLEGRSYFLAAPLVRALEQERFRVRIPRAIYRAERRSRTRSADHRRERVRLETRDRQLEGVLIDSSPEGLAVELRDNDANAVVDPVRVCFLDGPSAGQVAHGEVRHRRPVLERLGWVRIGLDISPVPRGAALNVERRDHVVSTTALERVQRSWQVLNAAARIAADRTLGALGLAAELPDVRIVDYSNEKGESIRAIVDSWGDTREATAVIIPPAWGRTKETLMPLAATIVAGFAAAAEPIVVVRFDGIRKRGESYRDPGCRSVGKEHHRFTFSQGVRDIRATLDFLERSEDFRPRRSYLVSFSAASIESRRALATDARLHGWVCVVGAADTQSMMRVISGGIDYGVGLEKGASYGLQEILGVEVDMDHAGWDAIQNQLAHLDDARRDMERIAVPVTWIHGRYDAWMDPVRAVDILSRGDTAKRRFIEVPTGHSLRSSREALDVFQLVTSEIARFVLGRSIPKVLPELAALERRRRAERERLKHPDVNLRAFWRNYLLGRSGLGGFDLMTRIEAYRDLMRIQIRELRLLAGARVADLGAGTGAFLAGLSRFQDISGAHVLELDFVRDALRHARARARSEIGDRHRVSFIEVDLNQGRAGSLPLNNTSLDAVLGSLLISYVPDPARMLAEIHRVLRPGGRLVLSVLRRDADMSKLFVEGLEELRVGNETCGSRRDEIDEAARDYLNQASSLLDLEEAGVFRFWDSEELVELVSSSGFTELGVDQCFGDPPQAVVVSATRA